MKLHEAIIQVLKNNPGGLTAIEIAKIINDQSLYQRNDRKPVPAGQIYARTGNATYARLFLKRGDKICLNK